MNKNILDDKIYNMKKIVIGILLFLEIIFVSLTIVLFLYRKGLLFDAPIPKVKDIYVDEDNYVNINFNIEENGIKDTVYFLKLTNNIYPKADDSNWKKVSNNSIKYLLDDVYYSYLKNEDNKIIKINNTEKLGKVTEFEINKNKIYLAIKDSYTPTLTFKTIGYVEESPNWYSENEKIAKVNNDGKITGLKNGKTKIHVKLLNKESIIDVVVTDLITIRPKNYDRSKKYVPCGKYSKEDNDLLDEILVDRTNDVEYKTRASVVEAARFITLEFPYKIKYFSENGRLSGNGVDGEGRYYHKGLYLDESRFKNISKSHSGPATWGCYIYSRPAHGEQMNGLDCSGFITWILYNGGFNIKDVGAGLSGGLDLTDYGKRTVLTKDVVNSGKIKVGDLLSSGGPSGGHIALIAGIDKDYYYVVESLWTYPNVAALMMKYPKKSIHSEYYYVMLMDSYYKKDGKLTNMWY